MSLDSLCGSKELIMNFIILPKIEQSIKRPLWSVLIPTYNCANYLEKTLLSVLQQDMGDDKMEIIVIDDHSTKDNPEEVVNRVGEGRVQFIRQEMNVGKVRNYETGLLQSKGYFIHQLHGDDIVMTGFYQKMESLFNQFPNTGAAFCRTVYIDENGIWRNLTSVESENDCILNDWLPKIAVSNRIQTPSMVVKREVYETIGTFDRRLDSSEDWEMWIRIANNFQIAHTPEVLSLYRTHTNSTSTDALMSTKKIQEFKKVFEITDSYLSKVLLKKIHKQRKENVARYFIDQLSFIKTQGNKKLFFKYIAEILRNSIHPKVMFHLLRAVIK